jgi:NAD(P)-dependent dehydrogenase (short-subunit alcohol dehydrogenase family)
LARALIVGCGCRGRALASRLLERGWAVRGSSRDGGRAAAIGATGAEPAVADPDRPGTVLELVGDVTVVHWLLGSALGEPELIGAIHGPRLESLVARLVDTPVRGFVYEAGGSVPREHLERGAGLVESAGAQWRIPVAIIDADPADHESWLEAMLTATSEVLSQHRAA